MELDLLKFKRILGRLLSFLLWVVFSWNTSNKNKVVKVKNVLILNDLRIGDLISITPLLKILVENKINITLAIRSEMKDLFLFSPEIKSLIYFENRMDLDEKLNEEYDALIDFHPSIQKSSIFFRRRIPIRICLARGIDFNSIVSKVFFTHIISKGLFNESNVVEENIAVCSVLGVKNKFKISPLNYPLRLSFKKDYKFVKKFGLTKNYAVISPQSITSREQRIKFPSASKFASIAEFFIKKYNLQVVFIGQGENREECNNIVSLLKDHKKQICNIAGETNILEVLNIISNASILIGVDSGPIHIAAAQGTKLIDIILKSKIRIWAPWTNKKNYKLMVCKNNNLDNFSLKEIYQQIDKLLR